MSEAQGSKTGTLCLRLVGIGVIVVLTSVVAFVIFSIVVMSTPHVPSGYWETDFVGSPPDDTRTLRAASGALSRAIAEFQHLTETVSALHCEVRQEDILALHSELNKFDNLANLRLICLESISSSQIVSAITGIEGLQSFEVWTLPPHELVVDDVAAFAKAVSKLGVNIAFSVSGEIEGDFERLKVLLAANGVLRVRFD